jgi:hypothetical protein
MNRERGASWKGHLAIGKYLLAFGAERAQTVLQLFAEKNLLIPSPGQNRARTGRLGRPVRFYGARSKLRQG